MSSGSRQQSFVEAQNVKKHYQKSRSLLLRSFLSASKPVRAVDDVSLQICRGEVLGLVGESGSGKSTLGRMLVGLEPPSTGSVHFDGIQISSLPEKDRLKLRRRMQMILQDPAASLSPRLRISFLLSEPFIIHKVPAPKRPSVSSLLEMVELGSEHATKFPHELSGGQARRVSIARALALDPEFLVADEPTAGLDVSAAANIINLMERLKQERGLTYLVITHDLNIVGYMADRIAVMYLGKLVEVGPTEEIFDHPRHPYTKALIAAIPDFEVSRSQPRSRLLLKGEIPSPKSPPPGCRFHTRCPHARDLCISVEPKLSDSDSATKVACHFWSEIGTEMDVGRAKSTVRNDFSTQMQRS